MNMPHISLIPMYGAIAQGRPVTLDVLVKIEPPALDLNDWERPPLNLGFVLDKSGSMSGQKLDYAKQAIAYGIEQLLPSDRLSLTLFDSHVETAIASTLATNKSALLRTVKAIRSGSATALHGGWVNGGMAVSAYLHPEQLNRIIILSDGLANVGETDSDTIANDVHGLMKTGISTSALGVGRDYDENLLEAIARSGDGNFFHIASPEDLPQIFETELQGLAGTLGRHVTLRCSPLGAVHRSQVVNDLATDESGGIQLPNLTVANPIQVVIRLQIPALTAKTSVLRVQLQWQSPDQETPHTLEQILELAVVSPEAMANYPPNPAVQEQVALLMAAKARQEAIANLDQGKMEEAVSSLETSAKMLAAMPQSAPIAGELSHLEDLVTDFKTGDTQMSRKQAMAEMYQLNRSRSSHYGKKKK